MFKINHKKVKGLALAQILLAVALGSVITIGTIAYFSKTSSIQSQNLIVDQVVSKTESNIQKNKTGHVAETHFNVSGNTVAITGNKALITTTTPELCHSIGNQLKPRGTIIDSCSNGSGTLTFTPSVFAGKAVDNIGLVAGASEGDVDINGNLVELSGNINVIANNISPSNTTGTFTQNGSSSAGGKNLAGSNGGGVDTSGNTGASGLPVTPSVGNATTQVKLGIPNIFQTNPNTTAKAIVKLWNTGKWSAAGAFYTDMSGKVIDDGKYSGTWMTGGNPSDYSIQVVMTTKGADEDSPRQFVQITRTSSWLSLANGLDISQISANGNAATNVSLVIKDNRTGAIVATDSFALEAEGACMDANTLVLLDDGKKVAIKDLKVGDTIVSFVDKNNDTRFTDGSLSDQRFSNLDSIEMKRGMVTGMVPFSQKGWVKINGVKSTPEHIYFVFDKLTNAYGWKEANEIVKGDFLVSVSKKNILVTSIKKGNSKADFVKLSVNNGTFAVQDKQDKAFVLVHNRSNSERFYGMYAQDQFAMVNHPDGNWEDLNKYQETKKVLFDCVGNLSNQCNVGAPERSAP